jgi:ABC-type transporter Mla subunit MlaD
MRSLGLIFLAGLMVVGCTREPSVTEFCERVAGLDSLDASLGANIETLDAAANQLADLASASPTEVRGAVETLARALGTMRDAAAAAGEDEAEAIDAALRSLEPDLATIEEASSTLGNYVAATCGRPLGAAEQQTSPGDQPPKP